MKKEKSGKPVKRLSKRVKERRFNRFITVFTILLFAAAFAWIGGNIYTQIKSDSEAEEKYKSSLPVPGKAVPHNLVCMVNNMYMGSQQIAVPVNNKTYYGCCQKCVNDLNTDESTRFAVDPFSKKMIDKAVAFITTKPDMSGVILYFESEENAKKYFSKMKL
jgi:YHS domain-containing protein